MFTRLLICFLSFVMTSAPLLAQWEWVDNSQGSSNLVRVESVAVDSVRDDVYSVGFVTGNPNFPEISNSSYKGGDDGFVMKYNLAGVFEWGFLIGGLGNDRVNGVTVDQTTGNIFVTGFVEGTFATDSTSLEGKPGGSTLFNVTSASGGRDAFVACYNVLGNLIWKRIIGGSSVDQGMDIDINANGVYVTGFYTNTIVSSSLPLVVPISGEINNFVIALNPNNGNVLWNAALGSPGNDYVAPATNLDIKRTGITADENSIYLVTYFAGTVYNVYDGVGFLADAIIDPNGSAEDYVVTSYSNSGSYIWSTLYDNEGSVVGTLDITNDCEGVYVSGVLHVNGVTPGGTVIASAHDNFLLSKLDKTTGSELWLKEFQSTYNHQDYFVGIDADGYGNIYAVGRLRGTSASLGTELTYASGQDHSEVMIAHFQSDGTFKDFEVVPSSQFSWGMSIATYKNEKYVVGGYYNNTITFGSIVPNTSSDNAFVAVRDLGEPISYVSAAGNGFFCQTEGNAIPNIHAPDGGVFSGPSEVVFVDVNTGEIDLAASTPGGFYTITYTGFPAQCSSITAEFDIYILAGHDATFTYPDSNFCVNGTDPVPTVSGTAGGTFSAPAGLTIVGSSGTIDLSASSQGSYYVVYTTVGFCSISDSFLVNIDDTAPNPDFGYGSSSQCAGAGTISPSYFITPGGTYSAPPGIVFSDITNGVIDLNASTAGGPYAIQYLVANGGCADSATFDITILASVDPSFTFTTNYLCVNEPNVTPATVANPGVFTTTSALNIPNASTGEIDASNSPVGGPYRIYHTTFSGGCQAIDSLDIYIEAAPDASFDYAQSTYCAGSGIISPSFIGLTGGTFSAPAGLALNTANGEIDINASTVGTTFTIKYVVANTYCQDSSTVDLIILPNEIAFFSYPSANFCQNEPNPAATATTSGGTFSGPAGLDVNSASGMIDVTASTIGGPYSVVYTTGGSCPSSYSVDVYIEAAPNPSFTYSETEYCDSIGTILPNTLADSTGTFSAPAGLSLNTSTGEIDIDASTPNTTYQIKYVVSNAFCQDSATFSLTINELDDASFTYSGPYFCNNEPNPSAMISGDPGTFTAPSEIMFVDNTTGEINAAGSTVGGPYYIVYTTNGITCPNSDSVQVWIDPAPNPSFTYAQTEYCDSIGTILPNTLADSTGTFSAPAGLSLNTSTGEIDIDASTPNATYLIKYVVSNSYCQDSVTFSLTINELDDASFTYSAANFCENEPNPTAVISGDPGIFTASSGIFFADNTTGEINVATSTVGGPYYIVYTTNGLTCPNSDSVQVSIEAAPNPSFTYAQTEYCDSIGTILPNTLADSTGTFSAPAGLSLNTSTGEINIDASTPGATYLIKYLVSNAYCQDSTTFSLTINELDQVSFPYSAVHFCNNEPNQSLSVTGDPGTFSGPTELSINGSGLIDVTASLPGGPYYAVYTTNGTICPNSDSVKVYIETPPNPAFSYSQAAYCGGGGLISPTSPAVIAGTFSEPTGDLDLDAVTGKIDISGSEPGGPYTIQYLVSNVYCQDSATFDISILAQDEIISVDYGGNDFCISDENQIPIINDGMIGGTFSGSASIEFVNTSTGEFSPSSSFSGGPYLIKYVTSGVCPDSLEQFVTIFDSTMAYAGEDQDLNFILSSTLEADIPTVGIGAWSTFPTGVSIDALDPNSKVSNLSSGENLFIWTVSNGSCPKASDEIIIRIEDLYIPQALTPNDDGKNDFFEIRTIDEVMCSVQIFNRWGQLVYENSDYQNEWYGQNMSGKELESDTYFYVILIEDSLSYNGYVVLKK